MEVRRSQLAVIGVVVVWAGSFSVIKVLLDHGMAAADVALLRYAIAAPGFGFILWRARGLPGLTRADALRIGAAGMIVVVGYHVSLNLGESRTTSGVAALVVALAPGMTFGLAVALGLDRASWRRFAGLGLAFAGVVVVVALGVGEDISLDGIAGPLIVLGAPLSFALYNVVVKPLLSRYDLLAVTAASSLVGTVALVPFARGSTVDTVVGLSVEDAALVLYLGLLATLLGYIAWNVGLRGLGPTRAASYTYAVGPLAVVIGTVALGETLSPWLVAGGALVVGGIALTQGAQWGRRRADGSGRRAVLAGRVSEPCADPSR
jgi:drug/metabolite transporter (DMT)-like permease